MTKFTNDLEKTSALAANILRADMPTIDDVLAYREVRLETNFVAQTYHFLRSLGNRYKAEDSFLEYMKCKRRGERGRSYREI